MAFVIEPTHLNSLAVHIVKTLEARGYDKQALLRQAGIDATELDKADGRLPSLQVDRL